MASAMACLTAAAVALAVPASSASGSSTTRSEPAADGATEQGRLAAGHHQVRVDYAAARSRMPTTPTLIRLRTRTFDPTSAEAQRNRPRGLLRSARGGAYLVQFTATPLDSQRDALRRLGARVGAYIPDAAYVVRMDQTTRAKVAALPYVRWVGPYDPGDKIEGGVVPTGTRRYILTLVERDAADQRAVIARITALGGTVHVASASRRLIEATLSPRQALAAAHLDAVLAMDLWSAPEDDMNNARIAGGANAVETALGYRGQGVRGEVMDGGLRTTHQEFAALPPIVHAGNTTSTSHGTSTYGGSSPPA